MNSSGTSRTYSSKVLYSIIVPVYNAATTIHRCVDSILAQTEPNFELILVNDGSKDSSASIIDEYASLDKRIKVLHKVNGGVSSARNLGLSIIRGEYVTFIDSDDFVSPDYLASFNQYNSDLVIQGVIEYQDLNKTNICRPDKYYNYNRTNSIFLLIDHLNRTYIRSPWCKIYKVDIIRKNKLIFNEQIHFGEDFIFNLQFLNFCNIVEVIPEQNYCYFLPSYKIYKMTSSEYDTVITNYLLAINKLIYSPNPSILEAISGEIEISKTSFYAVYYSYIAQLSYLKKIKEVFIFLSKKLYRHTHVESNENIKSAMFKRSIEVFRLLFTLQKH